MFRFTKLGIPDIILIETDKFNDDRGCFFEHYKESAFKANGILDLFEQDSFSNSKKGVIRGLHYQKEPMGQGKLVSALSGKIFDVAVDLRKGSPHFGKWVSAELSSENCRSLWVPVGFAHGFAALEDDTVVLYKTTHEYSKEHEGGVIWNDPDIGIKWPIRNPTVSEKDGKHQRLRDSKSNFVYKR